MALSNFNQEYQLRYQDVLLKQLVATQIATTELKSNLIYGQTVHRPKIDTSNLKVRDVTRYVDRTIPQISDADQTMTVNKQKAVDFAIDDWDKLQAGPLSPDEKAGEIAGSMLSQYIDADVLAQVTNAAYKFDTGNLTGTTNSGTPITLSTSNAAQIPTQLFALLTSNNIRGGNLKMVVDPYMVSMFQQLLIGKNIDLAGSVLKNGNVGPLVNFDLLVSTNLTGEAVLTSTGNFAAGEIVVINGVTFTFVTTIGATPGNVLVGGSLAASLTNLAALINAPGVTTANGVALSTTDQSTLVDINRITATAAATTLTIVGIGSGRLTLSETGANASWTTNFVHGYAGLAGGIDLVLQQDPQLTKRDEPKQKTTNYLNDALYGVKVFDDRAKTFVDLRIANA